MCGNQESSHGKEGFVHSAICCALELQSGGKEVAVRVCSGVRADRRQGMREGMSSRRVSVESDTGQNWGEY